MRWSEQDIKFLRENYRRGKAYELAERLGRSVAAVRLMAFSLRLTHRLSERAERGNGNEPTELRRPILVGQWEMHRFLACCHYDICLTEAAKANWMSFSCSRCRRFQQRKEVLDFDAKGRDEWEALKEEIARGPGKSGGRKTEVFVACLSNGDEEEGYDSSWVEKGASEVGQEASIWDPE